MDWIDAELSESPAAPVSDTDTGCCEHLVQSVWMCRGRDSTFSTMRQVTSFWTLSIKLLCLSVPYLCWELEREDFAPSAETGVYLFNNWRGCF